MKDDLGLGLESFLFFHDSDHLFDAPVVGFEPDPLHVLVPRVFVEVRLVEGFARVLGVLAVAVGLLVLLVLDVFEGKPYDLALASVDDDPFEERLGSDAVLHPPHNLELVVVDLADVGDGGGGPTLVLVLVLFDEGRHDISEMELVLVVQHHLVLGLYRLNVDLHHLRQLLRLLHRRLVELKQPLQTCRF